MSRFRAVWQASLSATKKGTISFLYFFLVVINYLLLHSLDEFSYLDCEIWTLFSSFLMSVLIRMYILHLRQMRAYILK